MAGTDRKGRTILETLAADALPAHVLPALTFAALGLAFLAAAAGTLPPRPLAMTGTVVLALLGGLAGLGMPPFWALYAVAVAGAMAGARWSFHAGRAHRLRLDARWPFSLYPRRLAAARHHFARHGDRSVLSGRFVAGIGAFLPAVAGAAGMSGLRFAALDGVAALAWAALRLAPAALVVLAAAALGRISDRLALAVVILVVGIALSIWVLQAGLRLGLPLLSRLRAAGLAWAGRRGGRTEAVVARLAAPHHAEFRLFALLVALIFLALGGFLVLLEGVATGDPLLEFDTGVSRLAQELRIPWIDRWLVALTLLGDWVVTLSVVSAAAVVLAAVRRWRLALGLALSMGATMAFVQAVKLLVQAPRPIEIYGGTSAFSFPSGHATLTASLYGILGLLAFRFLPRWAAAGALAVCGALIAVICLSRVYLAAHWPTDVIAGLLFGAAMTATFALVFRAETLTAARAGWLFGICGAVLLLFGGGHVIRELPTATAFYAVREPTPIALSAPWRAGGWRDLPDRRIDLEGEREEPLLLQWDGSASSLRAALQGSGWRDAPGWSLADLDGFLQGAADPLALPVLPRFDDGRRPALVMLRRGEAGGRRGRFVLRAWPRRVSGPAAGGGTARRILLGSIEFEPLRHPLGLFSFALPAEAAATGCDGTELLNALPAAEAAGSYMTGGEEGACGGRRVLAGPAEVPEDSRMPER